MNACELSASPDVELYFYGELDPASRGRVAAHVAGCADCRDRLEDLDTIRRVLASRPVVDAPPAGDWSGFMRRLDAAVGAVAASPRPSAPVERAGRAWSVRHLAACAALLAMVTVGVFMAARAGSRRPAGGAAREHAVSPAAGADAAPSRAAAAGLTPTAALREISAEHLERSKLVVLGLAARDPRRTRASDWQYERRLAEALLPDTRLYRLAAQERGVSDVARVMRDLETVLLEASMSDGRDRASLARVQRLITRRGLVTTMQMVAVSPGL